MTAQQTSLSDEYPIQTRGRNAILLFLFLVLLVVRLAASLGETLHYDEPFWFSRGDLLIEELLEGDWDSLQDEHWMVARMEGQRQTFQFLHRHRERNRFPDGPGPPAHSLRAGRGGNRRAPG